MLGLARGVLGLPAVALGFVAGLFFAYRIVVRAFSEGPLWGFLVLLVPGAAVVFVAIHWRDTRRDALGELVAIGLMAAGAALSGRL